MVAGGCLTRPPGSCTELSVRRDIAGHRSLWMLAVCDGGLQVAGTRPVAGVGAPGSSLRPPRLCEADPFAARRRSWCRAASGERCGRRGRIRSCRQAVWRRRGPAAGCGPASSAVGCIAVSCSASCMASPQSSLPCPVGPLCRAGEPASTTGLLPSVAPGRRLPAAVSVFG
jgi:hypothetical protein